MTTYETQRPPMRRGRRQRRRTDWPPVISFLILLLACVLFFMAGYNTGLAAGARERATETVTIEPPPVDATPLPEPDTSADVEATPVPEASIFRDDIVSDGNALSYELQEVMLDCAERYEVPYALLLAIAEVETHFDPDAVSPSNDYGLMQINQVNHGWLLELGLDPLTHAGNIEAGAYIISQHLQNYGEPELALMAYNCGPGGARRLWDAGTYQTDYSRKVMTAFEYWTSVLEE